MHCLRSNMAIPDPREGALVSRRRISRRGALVSPAGESHLALEILTERLAEAQAETCGHSD